MIVPIRGVALSASLLPFGKPARPESQSSWVHSETGQQLAGEQANSLIENVCGVEIRIGPLGGPGASDSPDCIVGLGERMIANSLIEVQARLTRGPFPNPHLV